MIFKAITLVLALPGILAASQTIQAATPSADDLPTLVRRVLDPALDEQTRQQTTDEILAFGEEGSRQLYNAVRKRCVSNETLYRKAKDKHLKLFGKSASRSLRAALGKTSKIEDLQKRLRKLSTDPGLTKTMVKHDADPLLEELTQRLTIDSATVYERDAKLSAGRDRLLRQLTLTRSFWRVYDRADTFYFEFERGKRHIKRFKTVPDPNGYEGQLLESQDLLCLLAMPMSSRDQKALRDNHALAAEIGPEELLGVRRLNCIRLLEGRNAVKIDVKLCDACRDHSTDMAKLRFFSHSSPVKGKKTPGKRAANYGSSAGSENIARGQRTGAGATRAWWYSPGHHRNMMGNHGRVGLGRYESHWTQLFGG